MQKIYSLKKRRHVSMFYKNWKYYTIKDWWQIYRYIKHSNCINYQVKSWSDVFYKVQNKNQVFRSIRWVCLITGRFRGIFRLFMLSRLTILNKLKCENWNEILQYRK